MMKIKHSVISMTLIASLSAATTASADLGSRYGLPQVYASDVSSAEAYLLTSHDRGHKYSRHHKNPVIIDVRRVSEYVAGHPPGAYSVPFPHVDGSPNAANDATDYDGYDLSGDPDICYTDGCDDDTNNDGTRDPADYVAYVQKLFPDKDTPILTLCRTGYRSVQAANLLTNAGYTNVRNIWEGFVGQWKYAYDGGDIAEPHVRLDVNHDDAFTDADKDGWSGFQGLPVSTRIHPRRIFWDRVDLYY